MRKFIISMVKDVDREISSKRIITLLAFLAVLVAFLSNIFLDIKLQEFVFDGMISIVYFGLGATTAEKFSPKTNGGNDGTGSS